MPKKSVGPQKRLKLEVMVNRTVQYKYISHSDYQLCIGVGKKNGKKDKDVDNTCSGTFPLSSTPRSTYLFLLVAPQGNPSVPVQAEGLGPSTRSAGLGPSTQPAPSSKLHYMMWKVPNAPFRPHCSLHWP